MVLSFGKMSHQFSNPLQFFFSYMYLFRKVVSFLFRWTEFCLTISKTVLKRSENNLFLLFGGSSIKINVNQTSVTGFTTHELAAPGPVAPPRLRTAPRIPSSLRVKCFKRFSNLLAWILQPFSIHANKILIQKELFWSFHYCIPNFTQVFMKSVKLRRKTDKFWNNFTGRFICSFLLRNIRETSRYIRVEANLEQSVLTKKPHLFCFG